MTTTTRITKTFSEVNVQGRLFHVKREPHYWVLMGQRHGETFVDPGYQTRKAAIEAAKRIVEKEAA